MLSSVQPEPRSSAPQTRRCPACHGGTLKIFFEIAQIPILCNILCRTRDEALAVPRGDMRLGFCHSCGHVYNAAFDAELMNYNATYENSLQFSPRFQQYIESLAQNLIEKHGLHGKNIIEIGCGQGEFLSLLCRLGNNRGLGFDPSFDTNKPDTALADGVEIVAEHYSNAHADRPVDLLCCRHVLEHIPQPLEFLRSIRDTLGERRDVLLFFEVPSALFTLDRLAIWDLIYEHCSYFTPPSLRRIFELAGFDVMQVEEVYDRQFLTITARPARQPAAPSPDTSTLTRSIRLFEAEYRSKVSHWRRWRDQLQSTTEGSVIWGAGSKGVTFLNILQLTHDLMPFAVDLNPRKHGHFIVGTAQQIVAPAFLGDLRPRTVIVMNKIYSDEVEMSLKSIGLDAQILSP